MHTSASEPSTDRESTTALPLVVDLDGTLVANDLLWETASQLVSHHPLRAGRMVGWLRRGKAHLKRELWQAAPVGVEHLRYHTELVEWLRAEKQAGRTLVLASASDELVVRAVADHLGLFDHVLGSDGVHNLRSSAKADALDDLFPEGYEYVGNHRHDYDVWHRAKAAHVVTSSRSLAAGVRKVPGGGRHFTHPHRRTTQWLKALRPHQWVKNLLILLPLLTAQRVDDPQSVAQAALGFVSFSLVASSVYLLNDLADVENDRRHPTKRLRPFAAGTLSLAAGWLAWPVLALLGLGIGVVVSPLFAAVLVAYLVITVAYSFHLKRKPLADVLTLAVLYSLRIVAGAAAIDVVLSLWLLSFSGFFFLSLALIKRVSELFRIRLTEGMIVGRGYRSQDLELLSSYGVATSVASVLVFTLFVDDTATGRLYSSPGLLWASSPILLAWLMRAWLLAHRGEMDEDPILFAVKDWPSIAAGMLIVIIFAAATFLSF